MAEKVRNEDAPRGYIGVIMNFKNLRFMTLVKENCLISDLIHEAESTFAKLCSVKLTIKTLKNSVNAVLPHWYPVAPLIKNRDEIFAFADNAAESLNIDLTKHGDNSTTVQSTSPLGSGIMPDSGFASPTIKLGSAMESEEPTEMDVNEKGRKVGKNKADENLSQDELSSEVFSLKDHNQNRLRQNNAQNKVYIGPGNKHGENLKKNNTGTDNEKESSLKLDKDKVATKKASGKHQTENVKETMHSPRNELKDKSQNEKELIVSENTQKQEVEKSKTAESDSDSSSESSDESSQKPSKDKKVKKTSPQNVGKAESESSDDSSESSDDESVHEKQEAKSKPEVQDEMLANIAKNLKEKESSENKDDTKKLDTKSKSNETEIDQSSDSSSSSDDTEDEPTKNNDLKKSKVIDITMGNTTKESENIKETSGKKGEAIERGSVSSSLSGWSSDDEDKEEKTTKTETVKHKDNSQTADVDNNNDTANKNKKPSTPARKGEGQRKDNAKKKKGERKNGVNSDEQINVNAPPSPAKSLCHKKTKEIFLASPAKSVGYKKGVEVSLASFAKNVSRDNKSGSSKTKAGLTQTNKDEAESEGSGSTINAPFTQLPAKDKVNADTDGEESSDEEHAVKNGKDGKKGKRNADKNNGHADQIEPNDPDITQTPGKKSTRKSAVMLSTSKVASWLLSNPMSANAAGEISDETKSTQKTKKNRTKDNKTSEIDVAEKQIAGKTDLSEETKKNNESIVNKTVGEKRKAEEKAEEEQSTNIKKQKKKKTEENKKQTDKKTEANQDKLSFKTPVTTKKVKNTSLLLPKTSKGLSALVEDESDYSVKCDKKSKKRKVAPPTITRLKQTGFLTPFNNPERKAPGTKISKSRIKKTPASQPSKSLKMSKKEEEFLDNSVMNLDTLLNDETIKW